MMDRRLSPRPWVWRCLAFTVLLTFLAAAGVWVKTAHDLRTFPASLAGLVGQAGKPQFLDRTGIPLTITYTNDWNTVSWRPLYQMPEFLTNAMVLSEDRRFFSHHGPDWLARFHALWQNLTALSQVRGASTITEQVVRMIHPRPRTLWSRWLEGIEAGRLEQTASKSDILEFYLNQVPFAANRRGVALAARYYFDRDLDTLTQKEMMALVVLVRAPSGYDLYRNPSRIDAPLARLMDALVSSGRIPGNQARTILEQPLTLSPPRLPITAPHFVRYVDSLLPRSRQASPVPIRTTLDGSLQNQVSRLLGQALTSLAPHGVTHGAALVVDHRHGEILAWAVAGTRADPGIPEPCLDAVTVPRQPGSSLKPFLYCLALENGWTAATLILDAPLSEKVGTGGLHTYHNYSRQHYGLVTLRQALGNSLNIPAVRTLQSMGVENFLVRLQQCGITGLDQHPDHYGDGLALGNGEVSLLDLVQAYTVLANAGDCISLSPVFDSRHTGPVFSQEAASLISNILADPGARALEFGSSSLLAFPVETAVKTGTSSDYRDAWATGYNSLITAGVWMGNLDGSPTRELTGSKGPAMVLRSIFSHLTRHRKTRPLFLSPRLVAREIQIQPRHPSDGTLPYRKTEWFMPGTEPEAPALTGPQPEFRFIRPVSGLVMALDPRIPDDREMIQFKVSGTSDQDTVLWLLDGAPLDCRGSTCNWNLTPGTHALSAARVGTPQKPSMTCRTQFTVK